MQIYYHSWGDEDILSSEIKIDIIKPSVYGLAFEQEGFNPQKFASIKINGQIVDQTDISTDENGINRRVIAILFKSTSNLRPEALFELYQR
jgi:hypothetical protein